MKFGLKKALIVSVGIIAASGYSCVFGGNKRADVRYAINTVSEQFGTEFRLKAKRPAGGAECNIIAACRDTGDKEIRIFRFDKRSPVKTDYMFVKYGDEAYSAIRRAAEKAEPGCKVLVSDLAVNHFPDVDYDSASDLASYLAENDFVIKVIIPDKLDKDELIDEYKKLALSLRESGINCRTLSLLCADSKADLDALIPPDHIPHKRERDTVIPSISCSTSIYSVYRSLSEYCDDPDNIKDVLIQIDGVTVKKI